VFMVEANTPEAPEVPEGPSFTSGLEQALKEEQRETKECLKDVLKFLSHNTSTTRRRLAEALRQRAEVIETEADLDHNPNTDFVGDPCDPLGY